MPYCKVDKNFKNNTETLDPEKPSISKHADIFYISRESSGMEYTGEKECTGDLNRIVWRRLLFISYCEGQHLFRVRKNLRWSANTTKFQADESTHMTKQLMPKASPISSKASFENHKRVSHERPPVIYPPPPKMSSSSPTPPRETHMIAMRLPTSSKITYC
jgi:hypothetical protein